MSDQTNESVNSNPDADGADDLQIDELSLLKQRAQMLGVPYSNNIGLETLKERIAAKMSGDAQTAEQAQAAAAAPAPAVSAEPTTLGEGTPAPKPVKIKTLRQYAIEKSMKLVRIRVVNLDPKKKDLPGEVITVANEHMGTVSKYVPFGEVTDNGYHVPMCIYKFLKARKFLNIRTHKEKNNSNQIRVEQRWANEFAIEILPQLTQRELGQLAAAQAASGSTD